MNLTITSGRICTVPELTIMSIGDTTVCACKFVLAVCDGLTNYEEGRHYDVGDVDFFECIAFGEAAKVINGNFVKGSKIVCRGKMKNHRFEDANKTKHVTNVLLVEYAEFGDTESVMEKPYGKKKALEMSVIADLNELNRIFEMVCANDFLCINETDYYNIAISNM